MYATLKVKGSPRGVPINLRSIHAWVSTMPSALVLRLTGEKFTELPSIFANLCALILFDADLSGYPLGLMSTSLERPI